MDGPVLLSLLDAYAEAVVGAVLQHEGEVLKFMGDGLFAMFPQGGDTETFAGVRSTPRSRCATPSTT